MLRLLSWIMLVISMVLLFFALWPFLGYCSDRLFGLDCESQMIFSVNIFGPAAILGLVSSVWSLRSRSIVPLAILFLGLVFIAIHWFAYTL